ncbi:MarR family transcriptional regulator [uncultured Sphingomonas sp.]|jgi:DNA-binding MarR family transcriptional regulator|uniref:MarR family winged helix-turn-helix transcriptional regulator n=1 Tax=uncultured Sphingomonas sp. TaxID=158754 RepID=UPI0026294F92|nr:MarR family transcriptional regulator [uncultured Sphingomonas sp.]
MAILSLDDCSANRSPGRLLRRIDKLMTAHVESRFASPDLSFMQWVALKVVRDGTAGNPGELARELSITTGATTRMIDVLERRGLIERDRGAADRRVVRLAVTEAGIASIAALQGNVVAAWNEVLVDFEQADVDRVIADLMRLLAAVERVVGTDVAMEAAE